MTFRRKLRVKADNLCTAGMLSTPGGTASMVRKISITKTYPRRHEWQDKGMAPGGLGENFGDHLLVCKNCGRKHVYAAIDHNIFEMVDGEICDA